MSKRPQRGAAARAADLIADAAEEEEEAEAEEEYEEEESDDARQLTNAGRPRRGAHLTAMKELRIVILGFGTARQEMALA
jgi:hypothetical protein